jgi:hypothetical protein
MTTTRITASCPTCGTESLVPVDALLVSVAFGADGSEADAEESSAQLLTEAASVAWTCPTCQDLAQAIIGWPMLLTLASAGVELLDDGGADDSDPYPERSAGGPPLTADDALDLHALLGTDDWLDAFLNDEHGRTATSS